MERRSRRKTSTSKARLEKLNRGRSPEFRNLSLRKFGSAALKSSPSRLPFTSCPTQPTCRRRRSSGEVENSQKRRRRRPPPRRRSFKQFKRRWVSQNVRAWRKFEARRRWLITEKLERPLRRPGVKAIKAGFLRHRQRPNKLWCLSLAALSSQEPVL